jgi:glycosyltransferase involved in cell wall biosynthesis
MTGNHFISVIIPTRNRSSLLEKALKSLLSQTLSSDEFEVIVVDNGSTDTTSSVVESFFSLLPLRYFFDPTPGLHVGRHRGLAEAQGEILVYADDDIEALPTWLSSIQEAFTDRTVAMVGGNNFPLFLAPPPDWLKQLWQNSHDRQIRSLPWLSILEVQGGIQEWSPYQIWGCNFSIRKSVLLEAQGFHPDGMPKDLIRFRGDGESHVSRFVVESGMKALFHPGASVYHKVTPERMTYDYFRQRGFNQGVSDSYTQLRAKSISTLPRPLSAYRIMRSVWSKLRSLGLRIRKRDDIPQALVEYKAGYREGFAYHQDTYRTDPEVREWVHRATYY